MSDPEDQTFTLVPLTKPEMLLLLHAIGGPMVEDPERFAIVWRLLHGIGGLLDQFVLAADGSVHKVIRTATQ